MQMNASKAKDFQPVEPCVNCNSTPSVFIKGTKDYEYGVDWSSVLVKCSKCGLVTQEPRIRAEDIPKLYPDNYFVHSDSSKKKGIYSFLKKRLDRIKIGRLTRYLPENAVVIEVGCGNGGFLLALEQARPDLLPIGIDIVNPGTLDNSNVKFYTGQLEDQDIQESSVDLIFFDDLLEHVENPVVFLEACYRLLRPGGVVFGITPDHASVDRLLFQKYWAGYHYPRHTFLFDHHNIAQILRKSNFSDVKISGSNGLWVKSIKNIIMTLPATKKRGLVHYGLMLAFYPLDILINLFTCHGEMSFIAQKKR